jgi:hypothetical protein
MSEAAPTAAAPIQPRRRSAATSGFLTDYVEKAKAAGLEDERIRQRMQHAGWPSEEIETALGSGAS